MHQPVVKTDRRAVGPTGEFRFRQQRFTGKQILQVAILYEIREWQRPHELQDPDWPFKSEVEWQDANAQVAMMLSVGQPPFPRKTSVLSANPVATAHDLEEWRKKHGITPPCDHHWIRHACPDIHQSDYFVCPKCNATKEG